MKLPEITVPRYTTKLPSNSKEVEYRPYLCAEEKLMMMAAQAKDDDELNMAVKQLIEDCCNVKVDDLEKIDIEWLYVKLVSCSVSPIVPITTKAVNCDKEDCPETLKGQINLDQVYVDQVDFEEIGFIKGKHNTWRLPITETIGIEFKRESVSNEDEVEALYHVVESIYDEETVYTKDQFTVDDFRDFIKNIPIKIIRQIRAFYSVQDELACDAKVVCHKCKRETSLNIRGLDDFFE